MSQFDISFLNADSIELHYWFDDTSHSMDAIVQNGCEYELIGIIKTITTIFGAEITIETEPLAEGGLRRYFRIVDKSEKKTAVIKIAIITSLFTAIIVTPITTTINALITKQVESIFEDKNLKKLQKEHLIKENEKIDIEIENLKLDTKLKTQQLISNTSIIKKKSNFYEALEKYPKVTKISVSLQDKNKTSIGESSFVQRANFKEFIITTDDLNPIEIDNAIIEIISPVLKKGDYKWRGIYNGEIVSFNMKSNEFKTLVQTRQIEFKNGSSIKCLLELERKLNSDGLEEIKGYNIVRVNEYFENDKPIETPEGKSHRQKQEGENQQIKIPFN